MASFNELLTDRVGDFDAHVLELEPLTVSEQGPRSSSV